MIQINQQVDIDALIEDIEFSKRVGMGTSFGSCELFIEAIETELLYEILIKHFPQIQEYIDGEKAMQKP